MFGDILRSEQDVAEDIQKLNNICTEWKHYKKMLGVCLIQCNIKDIIPCTEHKEDEINKKLECPVCKGTGFIVRFKEEQDGKTE